MNQKDKNRESVSCQSRSTTKRIKAVVKKILLSSSIYVEVVDGRTNVSEFKQIQMNVEQILLVQHH